MNPKLEAILFVTTLTIFVVCVMIMTVETGEQIREKRQEMCSEFDMELLSETTQLIGDDFITCYNSTTKETMEIPI